MPVVTQSIWRASVPPIPDFTNTVSAWALFNWNPVGYDNTFPGVEIDGNGDNTGISFDTGPPVAPYPLDWAHAQSFDPPYPVNVWDDLNGNANNLTQTGSARPLLDTTNKQVTFDGAVTGMAGANPLFPL